MVMTKVKKMLEKIWNELEVEAQNVSEIGILKRLIDKNPGSKHFLFAGLRLPSKSRVFMLVVKKGALSMKKELPQLRGFTFSIDSLPQSNEVGLLLSASGPVYHEIFLAVANDLYGRITGTENETAATSAFIDRMYEWQAFFEKRSPEGLSPEEQRGLYGELYFLQNILFPSKQDLNSQIEGWTGPLGRQHDFQFGETSVEVKTSSAKQHQKMLVTGEQQLDETLVKRLFVFFLSISLVQNSDATLPDLIQEIRTVLRENVLAQLNFEKALFERGYLDVQQDKYLSVGYHIREFCTFSVAGDFPRLTAKGMPLGVGDLRYSIAVDECRKYQVPESELLNSIYKRAA